MQDRRKEGREHENSGSEEKDPKGELHGGACGLAPERLASDRLCANARSRPPSIASERTSACASPTPGSL